MFSDVTAKVKNSVLVYAARMAATRERRRQEMTDAILRSAREGREVMLEHQVAVDASVIVQIRHSLRNAA